jgi:uncharacterized protein (UPF0179 family)
MGCLVTEYTNNKLEEGARYDFTEVKNEPKPNFICNHNLEEGDVDIF